MHRCFGTLFLLISPSLIPAANLPPLLAKIKAAGPLGAGSADAATAWRELSHQGPDALPALLAALDDATPLAANWLRSAVDAVAERATAAHRPLPAAALEAFLRDTRHAGTARRLAYELLAKADPAVPKRLLPTLLDDPGAELRYEAVTVALEDARKLPKDDPAAKPAFRKLLTAARDFQQVEAVAKELENRGEKVDLTAHFGFLTRWHVVAGFDNTDGKGFQTVYPPERGVDLAAHYAGKGGTDCAWKEHTTTETYGVVDFNKVLGKQKNAVAYGYAVVESPREQAVELRAASATALKIFLNGREAFARESYHQSFDADSHIAPVTLKAGRNTILVKVCQNDQTEPFAQNWMFQLRITDALGAPVPLGPAAKDQR
jgi:hypothetical protein